MFMAHSIKTIQFGSKGSNNISITLMNTDFFIYYP